MIQYCDQKFQRINYSRLKTKLFIPRLRFHWLPESLKFSKMIKRWYPHILGVPNSIPNNPKRSSSFFIVQRYDKQTKYCFLSGSQILSICWSYETELLVGLRASSVVAWCCPRAAMQPDWLALTTVSKDVVLVSQFYLIISV